MNKSQTNITPRENNLGNHLMADNKNLLVQSPVTLTDYIRDEQKKHPTAIGNLTKILLAIALGSKVVARGVNRAGLANMFGLAGSQNIQGEKVQKLDVYADEVFDSVFSQCGDVIAMVSEERDDMWEAHAGSPDSPYVIAFDPLDGSSNIDVNVSIGTIWSIYKRVDKNECSVMDFLQSGRKQVAAGYTIYGSSTMFVYTTGTGVHGFTLDPTIGEFILTHPNMTIPKTGSTYSCNEGNFTRWSKEIQNYVSWAKSETPEKKAYSQRYVGSLVADFHRTLLKGGIFLYPADTKNTNGKLRLLYECNPIAFIAEQAGGRAISSTKAVLDVIPEDVHQRVPFFTGSTEMVNHLETFLKTPVVKQ